MTMVTPGEGKVEWMKRMLYANAGSENLTLKLFKNNVTPAVTDTASTYTEATFTGYSAVTVTSSQSGSTWTVPSNSVGTVTSSYQTNATFSSSSSQSVYGYFVVGASSGKCYCSEAFSGGVLNLTNGSTVTITPQFTM